MQDAETDKLSFEPNDDALPEETSVGQILKSRRQQLGLKHKDIADQIKVKPRYMQAIEDGDFDAFPAPAYARMFTRAYAEFLELDVDEVLAVYDTHEALRAPKRPSRTTSPRDTDPKPEDEGSKSGGDAIKTVGIVAVIVVIAAAAVWIGLTVFGKKPPAELSTQSSVVDSLQLIPEDTIPAQPWGWIDPEEPFFLQLHATLDTWAYVVADGDTIFNRVIPAGEDREIRAAGRFRFKLGKPEGLVGSLNGYPMIAFVDVPSEPMGWEITRANYLDWLDSAKTTSDGELLPPGTESVTGSQPQRPPQGEETRRTTDTTSGTPTRGGDRP